MSRPNLALPIGGRYLGIQGWYAPVAGVDANGLPVIMRLNSDGSTTLPVKPSTAAASPSRFTNIGANTTLNVKAGAGNVFSLSCDNTNAAARFLQLHNTATTPAGGAAPLYSFRVPASSQIIVGNDYFTNEGVNFSTGIAFAVSTARDTYVAATAAEHSTVVHFA